MYNVALLGAGRIAHVHATHISNHPNTTLYSVSDVFKGAAQKLADQYGAKVLSVQEAINSPEIDIILIATSTDTHADFSLLAAKSGKAVFCEKPIDLDINRVKATVEEVQKTGVPYMVGFNRRFDPNHSHLNKVLLAGEVGELEYLQICSLDPAPAPVDYLKVSGGIFRDMTIHDFDMARFQLGEEPVSVTAVGSALVSKDIADLGDYDTVVVTLKTESGKIAVINNSRRSGYGYDQRIEAHCSKGALAVQNVPETTLVKLTEEGGSQAQNPLHFFLERYVDAFKNQWAAFIDSLEKGTQPPTTAADGLKALLLAEAALESIKTGKTVQVEM